jgi:type IV pilus assembly protein PilC
MAIYKYRALNKQQQIVKGLVEASSLESVAELLAERKLTIVSLKEQRRGALAVSIPFLGHVKHRSVVIFSRQLSVMLSATVPVVQALRILTTQTDDAAFKTVLNEMTNDVDGGMKLSSAFAKHPEVFSNFYIAMIRSGETSGRLDKVLNYLATQMEKDYDLMSRIKGAMVYPLFIIGSLVAVGVVMIVFVVPQMTSVLKESGADLPFMTRMLIGVSSFIVHYWWLILAALIGLVVAFRLFIHSTFGRQVWDGTKLRAPIFGTLVTKIIISRLATSLSTLIKGGVPISRALSITADVVSNEAFKALLLETVKEVEDGNSITTVMTRSKLVPTMLPQMLMVGEKTGRMDEVLDRLGDFFSREVDALIGSLTSLIEPVIMILLGCGVGLMVAAVILPMFQIANSIK